MNYRGEWLTRSEFAILATLTENEGMWLPATLLYRNAAGGLANPGVTVSTHVHNLRAKLRPYGLGDWIQTRPVLGYSWRNPRLSYRRSVYVDQIAWALR